MIVCVWGKASGFRQNWTTRQANCINMSEYTKRVHRYFTSFLVCSVRECVLWANKQKKVHKNYTEKNDKFFKKLFFKNI